MTAMALVVVGRGDKGRVWACNQRVATKMGERMVSRVETNPDICSCSPQILQTPVLIGLALGMGWMVESGSAGKKGDAVFS